MSILEAIPIWGLAVIIFTMRVLDVSLGTTRTLTVVQGRIGASALLGFFELLIWVTAISQVIVNVREHPSLILAYAGGFAAGNAVGIALERKLAFGNSAVRIVTRPGSGVVQAISALGHIVTVLEGSTPESEKRALVYVTCPRKVLANIIEAARQRDPDMFYVVERYAETSELQPLPYPTGWRARLKRK